MSRIVFDTNVIVSALLQPRWAPCADFRAALGGPLQLCVSANIYAEYEEVISRPRFKRSEEIIASALRDKGFWVRPTTRLNVCADPDDNMFLECAQAAQAMNLSMAYL
jgi:putative PIN family toxin of toxin-antitoxin system